MNQQTTEDRAPGAGHPSVDDVREAGGQIVEILGLETVPIGVCFGKDHLFPEGFQRLDGHRYCQALMLARQGQKVVLDEAGITCPAAAAAFGFRALPEGLRSGKGLVGFGIVADSAVGRKMFEGMSRFESGRIHHIEIFPLEKTERRPQIVIIEGAVEQLMWVVLSYMHATGGRRVPASTAVLQATCVDATIIPFLEGRLNFGFGCYGCRDATDLAAGESIIGFPVSFLIPIVTHLEYLNAKAIPVSRGKKAWRSLEEKKKKA